ncbi:MAG: hypothetical protein QM537_10000 [Candidatus Symbiobacter sp.]|nr:hypothetical protein [Candidatus Symbiobacter sp.]
MNNTEQRRKYLDALVDSLNRVKRFTDGLKRQDFMQNELVIYATMKALQDAYSAAIELSRLSHKKPIKLDWEGLRKKRNKFAHSIGDDIEPDFVWQEATVTAKKILKIIEENLPDS